MPPEATLPPELLTLGDNEIYLEELTDIIRVSGGITPFIGAGTSVSYNFPPWRTFLLDLADAEGIRDSIEPQLDAGQFEEAAGALMDTMGARFQNHFKEHFGDRVLGKRTFDGVVTILPQLTSGPIITTNFDHVLEGAFAQVACPLKPVWGHKITQAYVDGFHRNSRILYKLHGDVDEEEQARERL